MLVALYTVALATVFSLIDDEELQVVHMLEVKGQNAITALNVKDLPETCHTGQYAFPMPQLPKYAHEDHGWSFEANDPTVKKSIWIGSDISGLQWLRKQYDSIYWMALDLSSYSTDRLDLLHEGCYPW